MIGLIGGFLMACLTFYLVVLKFDSRVWVAGLSALVIWTICAFTGIYGCMIVAIGIGAMFKVDI